MDKLSQGDEKAQISVTRFIETESFQKAILSLRRKYKIPTQGFKRINRPVEGGVQYGPHYELKGLPLLFIQKMLKNNGYPHELLKRDVKVILEGFPLKSKTVLLSTEDYLFHNNVGEAFDNQKSLQLFSVIDFRDEAGSFGDMMTNPEAPGPGAFKDYFDLADTYPVVVGIHPDATQRDLLDFIKNSWNEIESMKIPYKSKGLNVRKTKIETKERNTFIYKNRDKKISVIRGMLAAKGEFLDDGAIGKIISLEKKRRK